MIGPVSGGKTLLISLANSGPSELFQGLQLHSFLGGSLDMDNLPVFTAHQSHTHIYISGLD